MRDHRWLDVAGAVGTTPLAIVLQRTITANVHGLHGGVQSIAALPAAERAGALPGLAAAFGTSFWVALALIAAALVPALLLARPAEEQASAAAQPAGAAREAA